MIDRYLKLAKDRKNLYNKIFKEEIKKLSEDEKTSHVHELVGLTIMLSKQSPDSMQSPSKLKCNSSQKLKITIAKYIQKHERLDN